MARRGGSWLAIPLIAVVVITIWVVMRESRHGAAADVDRIRQAMQDGHARKYRTTIALTSALGEQPLRGSLIVRGRAEFMLTLSVPLLGNIKMGSDGKQSWGVPPSGPVFVSPDQEKFEAWLQKLPGGLSPQMLHIDSMLEQIAANYDLERGDASREGVRLIRGMKRQNAAEWLPPQIELLYETKSGVLQKMTLTWPGKSTLPRLSRLEFEFAQEVSPPSGYFEHSAHHDAERAVVGLPDKLPQLPNLSQ